MKKSFGQRIIVGTILVLFFILNSTIGYAMQFKSINQILYKNSGAVLSSVDIKSSTGENLKFTVDEQSIKLISRDTGKVHWQQNNKNLKNYYVKIEEIKANDPKMTFWVVTNIGRTGTSYLTYDIIGPYSNQYVSYVSADKLKDAGFKFGRKETIINNEKLFVSHNPQKMQGRDDQFFQLFWDKDNQWFGMTEVAACE